MTVGKRPCLILEMFCDSEYICEDKGEEYAKLIALEKKNKLKEEFPHEIQPKARNHHTPEMMWDDPYKPLAERKYLPGILLFKTDSTTAPEYVCEVPVEGSNVETLRHVKRWMRVCHSGKARLDTRNGLTLEEFEQMIK